MFKLMSGEAVDAAGSGSCYCYWVNRFGKVVLNLFRTHVRAAVGVASMNILDGMKVTISLTSMLVMHPRRKARSAWLAGSSW